MKFSEKIHSLIWLTTIVSLFMLSSCGKKTKTVYHYEIANCKQYVNLRSEPNTSSRIVQRVCLGNEVIYLKTVHEAPDWEYWAKVRVKSTGEVGYVKECYIKKWTTEEVVTPPTMSERLEKAGQKVTPGIFEYLEYSTSVIGKRLSFLGNIFNDRDETEGVRMTLLMIAVFFALGFGASIWFCETIHWWHYLIALIFIPVELIGFGVSLPGNISINTDIFIVDIILNLIASALVLSLPAVHWYSSTALIGNLVGSEEEGKAYIVLTMLFLFIFVIGARVFPSAGDVLFYVYLGLNALIFILLNVRKIGPFRISFDVRLFCSFRGVFIFLTKMVISIVSYALLLGFTFYMIGPLVAVSLGIGLLAFFGIVALFVILSPMGMNSISSKYSTDLVDGAGRFVDNIDSSGWSTGGSGIHYTKGPDDMFHRD